MAKENFGEFQGAAKVFFFAIEKAKEDGLDYDQALRAAEIQALYYQAELMATQNQILLAQASAIDELRRNLGPVGPDIE